MLELLVGLACTGLLAAAVMPLLVGGARIGRQRLDGLGAQSLADTVAATVASDLAAVGAGLEGATAVVRGGIAVPLIEVRTGGVRIVRTQAPGQRVEGVVPGGAYRLSGAAGLSAGVTVAAVGSPGMPPGASPPLGTIVSLRRRGGVTARVRWPTPEALTIAAWGPPAELVPVELVEYATVQRAGGLQLRRRREGGVWQPVADLLRRFELSWALDRDRDGTVDGPPGSRLRADELGSLAWAAVEVEVRETSAAETAGAVAYRCVGPRIGARRLR